MNQIISKHQNVEKEDLVQASTTLMAKQFIYRFESTGKERDSFFIIKDHQQYFTSVFDAVGYKIVIDDDYGYIGLIPEHHFRTIKLVETLFLLVARLVYEEEMMSLQSTNDVASMSYEAFLLRYEALTGRGRPENNSKFNESIAIFTRYGVMKLTSAVQSGDDSVIRIYPGVMSLINKGTLEQIKELNNLNVDESEDETDLDTLTEQGEVVV